MSDVYTVLRGVSVGTQLRIERTVGGRAEGAVREILADALTLGNGEVRERIPLVDIVSVWRRSTWALQGALLGTLLGLAIGGMVAAKVFALVAAFLVMKVVIIGVVIFGVIGALFGGALGAWLPRWKRVWP